MRSYESFLRRLPEFGDRLRVIGPAGAPSGLCVVTSNEIDQLFVASAARGSGVAAELLADGEARLRVQGVVEAHVDCVIENVRAIRFYEKFGWKRRETRTVTLDGPFRLAVLILAKRLV